MTVDVSSTTKLVIEVLVMVVVDGIVVVSRTVDWAGVTV